ncbi:MAG: DUF3800 domain-containing protein [Planctomycetes bacterium]|nr:DUF3800 domain-containing protein [Planctomycetota bacterium]
MDCNRVLRGDGTSATRDPVFVLAAVSLLDHKWYGFEQTLNLKKRELIKRIEERGQRRLELAECELKSSHVRNPKERGRHPLLAHLHEAEIEEVVNLFYRQLAYNNMRIFAVVVDKDRLHDHMDHDKLHRKAWELLLERVHYFLATEHPRHLGAMMRDDLSKEANRSLAMKHAYLLESGTTAQRRLTQIVEMPMFVRSELSNGIQLADFVAYNFYRAFKYGDFAYPWFQKVLPSVWSSKTTPAERLEGLKVFPPESPLAAHLGPIGAQAAALRKTRFGAA